jgi:hypothetical protein
MKLATIELTAAEHVKFIERGDFRWQKPGIRAFSQPTALR